MAAENTLSLVKRKRISETSECKICGLPASYSYFGVISCPPCKIFFRRNAENQNKSLKCDFNGLCEININTRHACSACRLKKCFKQGMKIEMIRASRVNKNKNPTSKSLVKSNQIGKLPTINLLDKDNSLLDKNQWILLTNLIHNYQESKLFLLSERIKNENDSFQIINEPIVQDLLKSLYEIAGISFYSNNDITHLSADDRSILLHTAANNITCLGGHFIFYHSQLINDKLFWKYLEYIYGKVTLDYNRWAAKFTEPDLILFKLSLALFTFSTNSRAFYRDVTLEYSNLNQILELENKYTDLTWKYLIYKYGYKQAIQRFLHIIECFLAISVFMSCAQDAQTHVNDIESLIEQTELTLILDDVDRVVREDI